MLLLLNVYKTLRSGYSYIEKEYNMISYLILVLCIFCLIITYSCLKISKIDEKTDEAFNEKYVNKNKDNE